MNTIRDYFQELGINYTSPTKTEITSDYMTPGEVLYLKRKFVTRGGYVFAPLDKDVIEESINWVRKSQPADLAARDVIISALHEMCHYPRREFDYFLLTVSNACARAGISCPCVDFDEVVARFKGGTFTDAYVASVHNSLAH